MKPTIKVTTSSHELREFGTRIRLLDGVLVERPITDCAWDDFVRRGDITAEYYEVTEPQSQRYLDAVNVALDTEFAMNDFSS